MMPDEPQPGSAPGAHLLPPSVGQLARHVPSESTHAFLCVSFAAALSQASSLWMQQDRQFSEITLQYQLSYQFACATDADPTASRTTRKTIPLVFTV